ncbi:Uma2 family endonuclease [Larkinella terrae]|uniref:Uma2 family endonuclease n=1 Tax=Larkinella terrae TaxID=2025311 RepID=A0A7K0EVC8_9BACT|nr:Uma2 family endonuclease [Larkinella terrae]MRS65719.1 Uma2 family endonuclease [Larkinella terrae]
MEITSLDQLDLTRQYTYADYLSWRMQERLELIRGYIWKMSPAPSRRHQQLVGKFFLPFGNYLKGKPCQVFIAPFDVRLPRTNKITNESIVTVVQPDLCIICDRSKLDDAGCVGAPDLVIEVLSKGNTKKEMKEKFSAYEEAGVREYWVVLPEYNNVLVYTLNEQGQFISQHPYDESDMISPAIFPELQIDLREVFEE